MSARGLWFGRRVGGERDALGVGIGERVQKLMGAGGVGVEAGQFAGLRAELRALGRVLLIELCPRNRQAHGQNPAKPPQQGERT